MILIKKILSIKLKKYEVHFIFISNIKLEYFQSKYCYIMYKFNIFLLIYPSIFY